MCGLPYIVCNDWDRTEISHFAIEVHQSVVCDRFGPVAWRKKESEIGTGAGSIFDKLQGLVRRLSTNTSSQGEVRNAEICCCSTRRSREVDALFAG